MSSTKKTSQSKKTTKKSAAKEKSVVKKAEVSVVADVSQVEKKERKRREVNKETIDSTFTEIQNRVDAEINKLRESTEKVRGIKFLRSVNKAIKTLHSDTKRVMKLKKKNNRKKTVVSGFLKPIKISPELAAFTGWDVNNTYSRVTVTKFICTYIKTNHLYNEADKRLILCDDKLKTLLKYDPANPPLDKEGKPAPLNYFRMQTYLKPHFIKLETPEEEKTPTEKKSTAKKSAKKSTDVKPASKPVVVKEEEVEDLEEEDV